MDFWKRAFITLGILLCSAAIPALASPQVSLHLSAFLVRDAGGHPVNEPLGNQKITAGARVRFVIEAHNAGASRVLHLTPSDPIPVHMSYVPGSAKDGQSTVEFSLDGKTFSEHPTVKVKTAKGMVSKPADPSSYRAIRWVTRVPLPANHTFTYSYEAQVNGLQKGAQ